MYGRPAKVSAVLARERAARSAVQHGTVIPHDHVARLLPVEGVEVLGLRNMPVQHVP